MNFKTTLGLVLLLVVVGGTVWLFFPTGGPVTDVVTPTDEPADEQQPIFDPAPRADELVRVEMERADKPKLVFERQTDATAPAGADDWRIVEPFVAPAENVQVMGVARAVSGLRSRTRFEAGAKGEPSLVDAGLDEPQAVVRLTTEAGETHVLEIGDKVPMSNDTYVRVGGEKTVHIAMRDLAPQVNKGAVEYRSKRLARFNLDEAVRVQVVHDGRVYALSRGAGKQWVLEKPVRAPAAGGKIRSGLLTPVNTLRAVEFVTDTPESLARYGLDEPFLRVVIETETEREVSSGDEGVDAETQPAEPEVETIRQMREVVIGGYADLKREHRYAKAGDSEAVVTVTQTDVEQLVPNLDNLRDPQITRFGATDIQRIVLTTAGETATLTRGDDGWTGSGDLSEVDATAVEDLVDVVASLEAVSFVDAPEDLAEYGLAEPRARLDVTAAGQVAPVTLLVGGESASGMNAYVKRGDDPTVMVVSAAQADALAVEPLALRARGVFTFALPRLRRIEIEREPISYLLESDLPAWNLVQPEKAPVNRNAARNLANDLSRLRASQVVGKGNPAEFGLDDPLLTIRFVLAPETPETQPSDTQPAEEAPATETEHALFVSERGGTAYARRADSPFIFELDKTVYDVMTAEFIDPRVFSFDADEVNAVTVESTGGTLGLELAGDQWSYPADPYVELSQKEVRDFVRDIAGMRAERYFAYTDGELAEYGLDEPPARVRIGLYTGQEIVLHLTQRRAGELPRVAGIPNRGCIFLAREADIQKIMRGLDAYLKPEKPE